ncbi:MAG: serine/threonine protein kinase [Myxococcota bacterium]|jgi:serine/threonine-protein kinase|nr:serine/threonine protein kinase [Myxococcota bacterium]
METATANDLLIGRTIDGKYKLVRVIGKGNMGLVMEADHLQLGRKIAIKLLPSHFSVEDDVILRFEREARTAASIGHNHIVEIIDVGKTEDGNPFMAMEYLDGQELDRLMENEAPLTEQRACHIMIQVLSALEAIHAQNVIHRDLKPANIFLIHRNDVPDYVKLFDFGLSKPWGPRGSTQPLTRTGEILGTPNYMSPEQAHGSKEIDAAADLWSCGVILYQMVTGELPFIGKNLTQVLLAVSNLDPIEPRRHLPRLSPALSAVIMQNLSKCPGARMRSARAFRLALTPFSPDTPALVGLPTTQPSLEAGDIAHPTTCDDAPKSRYKTAQLAVLVVIGAACVAGILFMFFR